MKVLFFDCSSCCPNNRWLALECWEWVVCSILRVLLQDSPIAWWQGRTHCGERRSPVRRRKHSGYLSAVELGHWHLEGVSDTGCWQRLSRLLVARPHHWHLPHGWLVWWKDNYSDKAWWDPRAWLYTSTWHKVCFNNNICSCNLKFAFEVVHVPLKTLTQTQWSSPEDGPQWPRCLCMVYRDGSRICLLSTSGDGSTHVQVLSQMDTG